MKRFIIILMLIILCIMAGILYLSATDVPVREGVVHKSISVAPHNDEIIK